MQIAKLKGCMDYLQKSAGAGLLSSSIISYSDGQSLVGFNADAKTDALLSKITTFVVETLKGAGACDDVQYYILDMTGDVNAVIAVLDNYCWAAALNAKELPMGMLLNVLLPEAIEMFKQAL